MGMRWQTQERYFRNQLAQVLRIPMVGQVHFAAAEGSSTNLYDEWLRTEMDVPAELMHTGNGAIDEAYDNCSAYRNDVVLIAPGNYVRTASKTLDKSSTHLVTLGGPNQRHCPTTATAGAVRVYCATTSIDSIYNITGDYVQIHGLQTMNTFSHNANRCDWLITGKNTYMRHIRPRGGNGADQLNHGDGGVPIIVATGTAGAGNGLTVEDSFIGSAGNNARSVGPGAVLFEGGTANASFAPVFRRCTFEMRNETNTTASMLIHLANADYSVDRYLLFDDCFFYNFWANQGGKPPAVIVDACTTTHEILIKNCSQYGFDAWVDDTTFTFTSSPIANVDGGEMIAVSVS